MIDWWIIEKSFQHTLTPSETEQLQKWLEESAEHRSFYDQARNEGNRQEPEAETYRRWRIEFEKRLPSAKRNRQKRLVFYWSGAAAVLVVAITTVFWLRDRTNVPDSPIQQLARQEQEHGKVRLMTADGKMMNLSSAHGPDTLEIDETRIIKGQGELLYTQGTLPATTDSVAFNRLEVTRGAEYIVTLEDGTRVWLNADSRLGYPVRFTGGTREVELQGEAYFEVSRNEHKPFVVRSEGVRVTGLGTEFNINSRKSGEVRTTLIKGKVQVAVDGHAPLVLQPGEQALSDLTTGESRAGKVNIRKYTAWRHGNFCFEEATMEEIFRELSLWYDIEVVYENERLKAEKFSGYMSRAASIASVLAKIERTTYIHFSINQNKITVRN